jgi:hypothetical protein
VQKNAPGKIKFSTCASVAESVYFESAQAIIHRDRHISEDDESDINFVCEFRLKAKSKVADKRIFMCVQVG